MHRSVYFYSVLAAFLGGVAAASFFDVPVGALWGGLIISGICLLTFRPQGVLAGTALVALVFGMYQLRTARVDDTILYRLAWDKADVVITGYIDGDWKKSESWSSVYVRALSVDGLAINERVLIRVSGEPQWRFGNGVQVTGRLGRAARFGDFDYPAYLRKEGVRSIMIRPQVQDHAIALPLVRRLWVRMASSIYSTRDAFMRAVRHAVPEPQASYLVGILVGGRAALPQAIVDDFSRTSTSHVLAISGYNITILATAMMAALSGALGRRKAMIFTLCVIGVFVVMTGASASVVRAGIMGALVLLAMALGRQIHIGQIILVSAAGMVWFNPLILRDDIGFQLSFVALTGLVYISPLIAQRVRLWSKSWLGRIVVATTAAQIAVLPLIVYYFNTLSVIGPLANVLILPAVPLAMALGFSTGIIGLVFLPLAKIVGLLAWVVAGYQVYTVRFLASLPWSAVQLSINGNIVIAAYGLLLLWWSLEKKPDSQYRGDAELLTNPNV